ncbi:hypothetical protein AC578_9131 [Pseudocercospora eumusae]|uniref:ARM repeat-containing protein n=1 Tax=Pseudocercospora eumusae TaxID=321146 RepID=A0A139HUY9_9PEZI|nr:hypothetical protein AC578_9131 [Pseudocercospora eumusae]
MASSEPSPEQRELTLVGKVEMRIALTDTDSKLESILKTYLAPLLLKLASPHESVRKKVITICQHVNTRVQPQSIQLPVAALIKQFKEQESSLIRHFDLLYIQQGVVRLSNADKAELLPIVANGIAKSGAQAPQIFYLLLRVLGAYRIPQRGSKEDVELRQTLEISDGDARYLASKLGKFILFAPQRAGNAAPSPGLTREDHDFFNVDSKPGVWDPAAGGLNLTQTKGLCARLLASGLFNDTERFLPALFASADPASAISDPGDDMMKRALPATDLEDEFIIKQFFSLYFGEGSAPRVKAPLRLKILNLLGKSTKSTTFDNNIMRMVDDGVKSAPAEGGDTAMTNGLPETNSIGREATKLRTAIFQYINFVARHGSKATLHAIAPVVVSRLRDFIENQGWPKPGISEDLVSRAYAYEVIGLLAKAGPRTLLVESEHTSLDLLRWLFDSLARDSSGNSITVSIEESLSTILGAMSTRYELQKHEQEVLEDLLIDQMRYSASLEEHQRLRSTRYVAVRFANRCLPYASVKARWVDILAIGATSDRPEVREEGERGLSPHWYRMLNGSNVDSGPALDFPAFDAVISDFFIKQTSITSSDAAVIAQKARELHESAFPAMTAFSRRMLFREAFRDANIAVNLDSEWERKVDAMLESDVLARRAGKAYLKSVASGKPVLVDVLMNALFECVSFKTSFAEDHLVEFLALSPDVLVQKHVWRTEFLLPLLTSNHHGRRMTAAHAFGILASHPSATAQQQTTQLLEIAQTWTTAVGATLSAVHGSIVALAFLFARSAYRKQERQSSEIFTGYLGTLFKAFSDGRDDLLREATTIAIGQMSMFGCLDSKTISDYTSLTKVSEKLYQKAKDGNEVAILSLGQLSMILPEDSEDLSGIEGHLHKLHEIRQSEVHFTVGEALSYLASGWQSEALATQIDIDIDTELKLVQKRSKILPKLLDKVLADCANTKPALKKAAVMWLLCLVQYCGKDLQNRLSECQAAFRRCLSDRDELVQESASRGLGLVYEKGDRKLKDDLVRELVSSFSSDKQQLSGNVSADTQLFEPGALPTGDGSVSTYKDIMSLASEVGDSSLVYKFMSMASSNAIWSSRAAFGRFGLSRVLSDSSVDGYLASNPKLYPKLFRYRFDPNGGVQRSMNEIWTALVPDSAATIDKHFDAIMADLLSSILGKEWRVRQACCAAIADLVQGRPLEKYEQYLERIWTQCFKVLDDIKESVRASAASLARTLTGVLTRSLEADHSATKNASAMLKHVLPFLLSPSGMESSAEEVQLFSVQTLLEIIKKANGSTLQPFIPELVERLIGLLSSLEPEAVNYVHLNAAKYNLTEQKIDDIRLSSVRISPLMEAIERCLDLLDEATMRQLWPKLENAMKSAVGLPSKVGSSRVLVSLSTRRMILFRGFADDALKLIERLVVDRNETVSSSYAAAAGYVARGASDKQIFRLIAFARKLYFESEGDREGVTPRRSIASGELMYNFAKQASDRFNAFATSILPFVFVAKHDEHEQVKELFQETWNEAVGGSRAVQLYLKEILEMCMTYLDSPQWALKHTAARAVADTIVAISSGESSMSASSGAAVWPAIDKALGGKTWDGKEVVLVAFVTFVEAGKAFYQDEDSVRSSIIKVAIREAKRQNIAYRQHSVKALARIALARTDVDIYDLIFDIVDPILTETADDEDAMEVDGKDSSRKSEETRDATIAAGIEALFASINPHVSEGSILLGQVSRTIHEVANAKIATNASILRSTFEGVAGTFNRVREQKREVKLDATATKDLKTVLFGPAIGVEGVRLTRADAIVSVARASPSVAEEIKEEVCALIESEVSSAVRDRLRSAAEPQEA